MPTERFKIMWLERARKQFLKIPEDYQVKIAESVSKLADWPNRRLDIKALQGRPGYRLRVGKYRVIFEAFNALRVLEIEEVKKRDERTY